MVALSPIAFLDLFCVLYAADCCITVVICLPEEKVHYICPLLPNYVVEMSGDLLAFCLAVKRRGGVQGSIRAV